MKLITTPKVLENSKAYFGEIVYAHYLGRTPLIYYGGVGDYSLSIESDTFEKRMIPVTGNSMKYIPKTTTPTPEPQKPETINYEYGEKIKIKEGETKLLIVNLATGKKESIGNLKVDSTVKGDVYLEGKKSNPKIVTAWSELNHLG